MSKFMMVFAFCAMCFVTAVMTAGNAEAAVNCGDALPLEGTSLAIGAGGGQDLMSDVLRTGGMPNLMGSDYSLGAYCGGGQLELRDRFLVRAVAGHAFGESTVMDSRQLRESQPDYDRTAKLGPLHNWGVFVGVGIKF